MRDTLTAIGSGCTMVGLIMLLTVSRQDHPELLLVAQVLVAIGFVLLIVKIARQWRS